MEFTDVLWSPQLNPIKFHTLSTGWQQFGVWHFIFITLSGQTDKHSVQRFT